MYDFPLDKLECAHALFLAFLVKDHQIRLCFNELPLLEQISRAEEEAASEMAIDDETLVKVGPRRKIETIVYDANEKVVYIAVKCFFPSKEAASGVKTILAEKALKQTQPPGQVEICPAPVGAADAASFRPDAVDLMVVFPQFNELRSCVPSFPRDS